MSQRKIFSVCLVDRVGACHQETAEVMRLHGTLTQAKQAAWVAFSAQSLRNERKGALETALAIYEIWPRDRDGWQRHELVATRRGAAKRWRKFTAWEI